MSIRRKVLAGAFALAFMPLLAHGIPITYSFTGQLTAFRADDGITELTLDSLGSRLITGTLSYDTDRQDVTELSGLFRLAFSGEGFFFDAGHAGIEGAQSINRDDTAALDSILFFEFYEYMLAESLDTLTATLDLRGNDLLNPGIGAPDSMFDPARLEYGSGLFGSTSWDYDQTVTGLSGAFDITSSTSETASVPEPRSAAPFGIALVLFALTHRYRRRRTAAHA